METYHSQQLDQPVRNLRPIAGFSLLEILFAIFILVIGIVAMASLMASTLTSTERSRFMSLAATLASEKLEDLNRWTSVDLHVAAGGSLTSDSASGTLNFYDDIDMSNTTGQVSETVSSTSGGITSYTSVIHKSTGEVNPTSATSAPTGSGVIAFHRRWLIEPSPVVNGVTLTGLRRVTVVVGLSNQPGSALNFQMSMLRP